MISINLLCCQKNVLIVMRICMIGKILMKQHYLKEEEFYGNLNMEEITDYIHGKRVCKDLEIKNLREYHNLYLESDTLLLTDVFENVRKLC